MSKDGRHNYDRDTSSDTEDYQDTEDHRRRVFKTRLRYLYLSNLVLFAFAICIIMIKVPEISSKLVHELLFTKIFVLSHQCVFYDKCSSTMN